MSSIIFKKQQQRKKIEIKGLQPHSRIAPLQVHTTLPLSTALPRWYVKQRQNFIIRLIKKAQRFDLHDHTWHLIKSNNFHACLIIAWTYQTLLSHCQIIPSSCPWWFVLAPGELIYSWHLKGGRLFETGLISFVEKLTNVQKKSLITETVKSNNKYSE